MMNHFQHAEQAPAPAWAAGELWLRSTEGAFGCPVPWPAGGTHSPALLLLPGFSRSDSVGKDLGRGCPTVHLPVLLLEVRGLPPVQNLAQEDK